MIGKKDGEESENNPDNKSEIHICKGFQIVTLLAAGVTPCGVYKGNITAAMRPVNRGRADCAAREKFALAFSINTWYYSNAVDRGSAVLRQNIAP